MNKPLFIAISGKKQSGKDKFALFLKEQLEDLGKTVSITHFADPLKEICIKLFGLDPKLVYGSNADKDTLTNVSWDGFPSEVRLKYSNVSHLVEYDIIGRIASSYEKFPRNGFMTHRELLQVMGTDIFRERVYQNIWAEYPFKQKWEHENVVLISDCRFPNEVEETLKHNGLVVRVARHTDNKDVHPSETALDDYAWNKIKYTIIDNNRTLDDLRLQAALQADLINRRYS